MERQALRRRDQSVPSPHRKLRFKTATPVAVLAVFALVMGLMETTRNVSAIAPASCSAILFGGGSVGDGMYTIDPAQNGSNVSVYCDMTTDGGGWTLAGYGANSNLGGALTAANGTYDPTVRTGSANIASVALAQGSTKVALSWSNGTPTGNLGTYSEAVRYSIPNPAGQTLSPVGGGYLCTSPEWTQVAVAPIVGAPNLPTSMFTRTASLGAVYGLAYGLVLNQGNSQCDWTIDGQPFRAVYLGINSPSYATGVVYQPGGAANQVIPNTMAIWFRGDLPVQTLSITGGHTSPGHPVGTTDASTDWSSDVVAWDAGISSTGAWHFTGNASPVWRPAYLVGAHPWGFVPGTDSWINCGPSTSSSQCGASGGNVVAYRVRFTIPAGSVNPDIKFWINSDNAGTYYINGTQVTDRLVGGGGAGASPVPASAPGVPGVRPSLQSAIQAGQNEMLVVVEDWGGASGFNYRADITVQGTAPIVVVPPTPVVTPTTTTVTFGPGPFVYNGSAFTATATVSPSAAGAATIAYSGDCTNAGSTCTATATFAATSTHSGSSATANITIDMAPSTTVITGDGTFTYDGNGHALTATVTGAGGLNESVPVTGCIASPTDVADSCTGTATYAGDANHTGSSDSATVTINPAPTTTSVTFGPGPFPYTGLAYTATASVSPAAAGSATVAYTGDCTNGGSTCTATATFAGSANYLPSVSAPASITITYTICGGAGGDTSPAKNSGSTIPVKVEVCASGGANVGSSALVVTAVGITPSASLADSGKANPGNLFRFDDGQYIFNLSLKGFAAGAYTLDYTVGNDPTVYHYAFVVRSR